MEKNSFLPPSEIHFLTDLACMEMTAERMNWSQCVNFGIADQQKKCNIIIFNVQQPICQKGLNIIISHLQGISY